MTPHRPVLLVAFVLAAAAVARGEEVAALRDDGALVTFDTADPAVTTSVKPVTGLPQGEILAAADFRPSDGALFAVGLTSRVYRVATDTGAAVPVGPGSFSPLLDGNDFGATFDTAGDGLRVTSNTGQSLLVDVTSGAVAASDQPLRYAAGDANAGATAGVTACAWTYSLQSGAALYGIDLARALLVRIDPVTGAVHTVGSLGLTGLVAGGYSSLDASPDTGALFAVLAPSNGAASKLYAVNTGNGLAIQSGADCPSLLRGAAVVPSSPPAPPETRLVGLAAAADVVTFTVGAPQSIARTVHVRGLPAGDSFAAIATRPSSGVLFGLTRTGLYDVDLSGGTAELVGTGLARTLPASGVSCDFDPATDRIRVVSTAGDNFVVHPDFGSVVADDAAFAFAEGDLNFGVAASVGALAFTGRATPGTSSRAFVLETGQALVARLGTAALAPNEARDGRLFTVGALAVDSVPTLPPNRPLTATSDRTGYLALQAGLGSSILYQVNFARGTATQVGAIGSQVLVRGLTAEPTSSPPRIDVARLTMALGFRKRGGDAFALKGAVPFEHSAIAGKSLTVDVGGLAKTFLLDAAGKGKLGDDTVAIGGAATRGIKLKIKWKKEDLVAVLADEDMTGATFQRLAPRQIAILLTLDGRTYRTTVDVAYSAKPGKSGTAKTN